MAQCTYYEKTCLIGGPFCKKNGDEAAKDCSEAAELRRITKLPCPILMARGYKKPNDRCDQPLIVRATLIKSEGNCNRDDACLSDEVLPGKRAELSQGLPGSKPVSLAGIVPIIKEKIRLQKNPGPCLRPATTEPAQ